MRIHDLIWNVDEETYRKDPSYHYSMLARYAKEGFKCINTLDEPIKKTPSLIFGSLVDVLVTGGEKEFNEKFYVSDINLSDTLKQITERIWRMNGVLYPSDINDIPVEKIIYAIEGIDYYNNLKPEKRVEKIKSLCSDYYNELFKTYDKIIINQDEYDTAVKAADAVKNHPLLKDIFYKGPFDNDKEVFFQAKFKTDIHIDRGDIPFKCMFDILYVDHKEKKIYPFDLKTTSKYEYEFPDEFIKWKYHIQANIYNNILFSLLRKNGIDYEIENFSFIVINPENLTPIVYSYKPFDNAYDMYYGMNITKEDKEYFLEGPYSLTRDIYLYRKEERKVPFGIDMDKANDLNVLLNQ